MNRKERVRQEIPGAPEELVNLLAQRPAAEVTTIVTALRQARRDALARDRDRRKQRRADARRHGWYDESVLAARDERLLNAAGRRAGTSLESLETLATLGRQLDEVVHLAVDGLRARGYSDPEIGSALGITRQSVGERFGRRGADDNPADLIRAFREGQEPPRCGSCGRVPGMPTAPCRDCPDGQADVRVS